MKSTGARSTKRPRKSAPGKSAKRSGRAMVAEAARLLSKRRKHFRGGRPRKPTKCARCGVLCPTAVEAVTHCRKTRKPK